MRSLCTRHFIFLLSCIRVYIYVLYLRKTYISKSTYYTSVCTIVAVLFDMQIKGNFTPIWKTWLERVCTWTPFRKSISINCMKFLALFGRIGSESSHWRVHMKPFYSDHSFILIICICVNIAHFCWLKIVFLSSINRCCWYRNNC